jgi:ferredoxin
VQAADTDHVTVEIDPDICIGVGACVMAEPDAFEFTDEGTSRVIEGTTLPRARAEEVCDGCPSGAISIAGE